METHAASRGYRSVRKKKKKKDELLKGQIFGFLGITKINLNKNKKEK